MAKAKLLVVDDEEYTRVFLKELLKKENYRVTCVEDGQGAIEAVKKTKYDLILLDIVMPTINGVETFKEIKKLNHRVKITIMITAYPKEKEIREAMKLGAYTCLHKPFDPDKVITTVRTALGLEKER